MRLMATVAAEQIGVRYYRHHDRRQTKGRQRDYGNSLHPA
jgi:predicted metal-dependent hydrolase